MPYTVEKVVKVYNDQYGDHVYVEPDGDGLDLVEIRAVTSDGKINDRIAMEKEQAVLVAKGILELYGEK